MYNFLYHCVFCLAFINFLNTWINLFFSDHVERQGQTSGLPYQPSSTSGTRSWLGSSPFIICSLLWFVLTLLIFFRIIQSSHFPLSNFYEALIFLTWCLVTVNFIILLEPSEGLLPFWSRDSKITSSSEPEINPVLPFVSVQKQVSGAILAPCILFIIAFAQKYLSSDITPLVPALKSNWLLMHVSIMICSYTTFIVGGLISFILLMQTSLGGGPKQPFPKVNQQLPAGPPIFEAGFEAARSGSSGQSSSQGSHRLYSIGSVDVSQLSTDPSRFSGRFSSPLNFFQRILTGVGFGRELPGGHSQRPSSETSSGFPNFEHIIEGPYKMQKKNFYIILDNLSYRMMGIGFPLFTLGILSGAVWANEAWGSYWSWDIKEVGSFINWLIVALYFHCRYQNFISLSHVVAFGSLIVLFFNFFGISLGIFGSSLHAYGASS